MNIGNLNKKFNHIEVEIIEQYLSGKSIRKISEEYKDFGRTKIKNIITRCTEEFPEMQEEIERKLIQNKLHKNDGDVIVTEELTEEQIEKAYEDIKNGKTLTLVAKEFGRTRDFVKKRIIDYINNPEEENEFLAMLKSKQRPKSKYIAYFESEEERKKVLFERLNERRKANDRPEYPQKMLEKKYANLKRYFLDIRNQTLPEEERLSDRDLFYIIYDTPTLLSSSLRNRIVPAMENLDYHPDVGILNGNKIFKTDASVLLSSIERTNLQIRILKDENLIGKFLEKPRNFRTSPELLYAMIQLNKNGNVKEDNIFITKTKLQHLYKIAPEDAIKKYDLKQKYSNDEYFNR